MHARPSTPLPHPASPRACTALSPARLAAQVRGSSQHAPLRLHNTQRTAPSNHRRGRVRACSAHAGRRRKPPVAACANRQPVGKQCCCCSPPPSFARPAAATCKSTPPCMHQTAATRSQPLLHTGRRSPRRPMACAAHTALRLYTAGRERERGMHMTAPRALSRREPAPTAWYVASQASLPACRTCMFTMHTAAAPPAGEAVGAGASQLPHKTPQAALQSALHAREYYTTQDTEQVGHPHAAARMPAARVCACACVAAAACRAGRHGTASPHDRSIQAHRWPPGARPCAHRVRCRSPLQPQSRARRPACARGPFAATATTPHLHTRSTKRTKSSRRQHARARPQDSPHEPAQPSTQPLPPVALQVSNASLLLPLRLCLVKRCIHRAPAAQGRPHTLVKNSAAARGRGRHHPRPPPPHGQRRPALPRAAEEWARGPNAPRRPGSRGVPPPAAALLKQ